MKRTLLSGGDVHLEDVACRIADELERSGYKLRRYQQALEELLVAAVGEERPDRFLELLRMVQQEEERRQEVRWERQTKETDAQLRKIDQMRAVAEQAMSESVQRIGEHVSALTELVDSMPEEERAKLGGTVITADGVEVLPADDTSYIPSVFAKNTAQQIVRIPAGPERDRAILAYLKTKGVAADEEMLGEIKFELYLLEDPVQSKEREQIEANERLLRMIVSQVLEDVGNDPDIRDVVEHVDSAVDLYLKFEQRESEELARQFRAAVYAEIGDRLGRDVGGEAAELIGRSG